MSSSTPRDTQKGAHTSRISGSTARDAFRWVIVISLAYVMFRPVSHNSLLLPALGLVAAGSLGLVVTAHPFRLPARPIVVVFALVFLTGIYGSLLGIGNPGLANGVLVWIAAPILFALLVWAADETLIRMILLAAAIMTIAISAIALSYVALSVAGFREFPAWLVGQLGLSFDGHSFGITTITLYGLSTLVATCPLWLTALILPRHRLLPGKWMSGLAGVAAFLTSLVAGRAAITIVALIVPIAVWIVWRVYSWRRPRTRFVAFAPLVVAALAALAILALSALGNSAVARAWDRVASIITGSGQTIEDQIRAEESHELIAGWLSSPVLGHGFGAVIPGYSRNESRPWNFELQYHLILFQVGIVGALVMLVAAVVGVLALIRSFRVTPELAPVLFVVTAGASALLIANASNPYLQAPGNMWALFLLLALINVALLGGRRTSAAQIVDDTD
ncbi:hypothetical protein ASE16_11170 [Leifsonia sp. Root227]|nr:hypothetical protein ASE16_11170 [Leifsonia sp. Root227]